jgi:hypothetical protein
VIDAGEVAEVQAGRFEDGGGIERGARLLGPDRNALALEIRERLDP